MKIERKGFPAKLNVPQNNVCSATLNKPFITNLPMPSTNDVDRLPRVNKNNVDCIKTLRVPGISEGQWC